MWPFGGRFFPGTNLQDLNLDWLVQRVRDLSKGILAPYINQANFHWMVYDTEAETFVDSGVSAAGEGTGPQGEPGKSPVIGSNGNWYVWDIETEAYTDTGITAQGPEGPVGPEGPEGPVGPRGAGVNVNFVDNGYFVYGKTIDADAPYTPDNTFPINQRRQASYLASGSPSIDRWNNGGETIIHSGYVEFRNPDSTNRAFFTQKMAAPADALAGLTCTLTVLQDGNVLSTNTAIMPASGSGERGPSIGLAGSEIYVQQRTDGETRLSIVVGTGRSFNIKAIKFEIGNVQTLAHQDNGIWILDDVPLYDAALLRCQRYFQTFRTETLRPTYGTDCRPVMAGTTPTKSTFTDNDITYYTLSV